MVSLDRGSASKVDDVTASRKQDGGYALLCQRCDNNKMAAICYYGNVMTTTRWWLCVTILHLQQYSHRLNLFFLIVSKVNIVEYRVTKDTYFYTKETEETKN